MQYRSMPKNNDELSVLGFGCMRLPMAGEQIDTDRAVAQIRGAIDQGVNYLDTAWPYHEGQSEVVLGKALEGGLRQRVKIATKLPSWLVTDRSDMDRYLDAQLEKLGVDAIDYYLVHSLNGPMWQRLMALEVRAFLDQALADGRIANAGFSFHGLGDDFITIVDSYDWKFCQIQYNFLDQDYQAGTRGLDYAAAKGLGVIVMEPLRGGNLALPEPPPEIRAIWDEAKVQRTPAEWALSWVWHHPAVTVVLSGMNEESHIAENLAIAEAVRPGMLSEEDLALVDRAAAAYRELMPVGCTGCGYCMPCPSGVNIPSCFETLNTFHMFKNEMVSKFSYATRMGGVLGGGTPSFASECVACGECLDKCPQQIPIPDKLEQVVAELEGPDLEERVTMAQKRFASNRV